MVIDANVVLRHVLADHPELSARADTLLEPIRTGQRQALLLPEVLAECVYVLEGEPGLDRATIAAKLLLVCHYQGLIGENLRRARRGLDVYAASNVSFVDALVACAAHEHGIEVMTFDKGLAKLSARLFGMQP